MNKEPKYNLPLTENEKHLIINALYLASEIHDAINHPYVSKRMKKLAYRLTQLDKEINNGKEETT